MHLELVAAKVVTVLLGFAIAVTAYRGYHRHGSWPMLYLAVGFAVISVGSVVEGVLFDVVGIPLDDAGAIQTVIVAVGMLVVLYSLHADAPLWGIGGTDEPPLARREQEVARRSDLPRDGDEPEGEQ